MYKRDRERRRSRESRETGREGDICSTRGEEWSGRGRKRDTGREEEVGVLERQEEKETHVVPEGENGGGEGERERQGERKKYGF